jgi:hypothetical protein
MFFLFKFLIFLLKFLFFIFLENKNLFSCGLNNYSQKCNCDEKGLLIPTKIDFFKNIEIKNIFTGYECTFIILY